MQYIRLLIEYKIIKNDYSKDGLINQKHRHIVLQLL